MRGSAAKLGATLEAGGVRFAVRSETADRLWVSVFDEAGSRETDRVELQRGDGYVFSTHVPGLGEGTRYGLRSDGEYAPDKGFWFDPDKLLVDPYATELDSRYVQDHRLAAARGAGGDTAALVPKALVRAPLPEAGRQRIFREGGLIYELPVRAFTMLHPAVPKAKRGTVGALAHPAIIEHLRSLGVDAIELMPVTATIDERHLPALGLTNAWGYNRVTFMALDRRLVPGGMAELRETVAALRDAGIGVILDLVFNHTGESDRLGPTLSFRGLDNLTYYRHHAGHPAALVNDTGCGNTVDCYQPGVVDMVLATLRHFVLGAGVDGFRFDLAPIMGRSGAGFDPHAPLLTAIVADPLLNDRALIAEPWDIGPDGYQLGRFTADFSEWNDRYRDDLRRFWRGDRNAIGSLATRLSGSSDIFGARGEESTRSVNFLAAHDGFSLADMVSYERKHNALNGEHNRDGHNENFSWNNGAEGESGSARIVANRRRDVFALLSSLFASRGTIMLTAGDEFGRTQKGNNNAYAQDNELTWLDWARRDTMIEGHVAALAALRREFQCLGDTAFLSGIAGEGEYADVAWLTETGRPMHEGDWAAPERYRLSMVLKAGHAEWSRLAVIVNGDRRACTFTMPHGDGFQWVPLAGTERDIQRVLLDSGFLIARRSVVFLGERALP